MGYKQAQVSIVPANQRNPFLPPCASTPVAVPSVSYLDAMDAGRYQQASQDEALEAHAKEGDALAQAFLVIARVHRDAATGNLTGCMEKTERALGILGTNVEQGWTRKALVQHLQQCKEYAREGKPLPELPSGI